MNHGDTVSHYRILSLLGSGGMGVVYLAEDLSLGRKIALKFLSRDFARDRTAVERFRREARTASALNHPNICTIHEISEHDGQPFIAMEWLEGQSLRDLLRVRRLSIDELLAAAIDVADGLDAAHRAGIVHRDIKPGNIFILARNRAKLLDFGLAKMGIVAPIAAPDAPTAAAPDAAHLTDPGVTLGTVAYMSPEQARAEEVDGRTDVFSLGLLLYEMATGAQAFSGPSAAVVFEAILNRKPVAVARLNPGVPLELDRSIDKALEKEKRFRYQHAAEIRADLERLRRDLSSGRHLAEARVVTPEPKPQLREQVAEEPLFKKRGLRKIFMLGFIPGVGALYNGQYKKAAIHVGVFILLSILVSYAPRSLRDSMSWVRIAFFFYMAFDAYHTAQKKI